MNKHLANIDYKIVHTTPGRIRISVPLLKNDFECASQIEKLLNSLNYVVRVRLNPVTSSIAIRYEASAISDQAVVEQIANCFRQVMPTNIYQQNQKQFKALDKKVETEEGLIGFHGGEVVGGVVGEIVGGVLGELLLGPIGATIASEVMGRAGGLIGESVSQEVADVMGLVQHLECQTTKKMMPLPSGLHQPETRGLTVFHLAKLWQTSTSIISAEADKGVMTFERWSQERYSIQWTFVLSDPANSNSEKLFFPA